jgi:hypothetical protein
MLKRAASTDDLMPPSKAAVVVASDHNDTGPLFPAEIFEIIALMHPAAFRALVTTCKWLRTLLSNPRLQAKRHFIRNFIRAEHDGYGHRHRVVEPRLPNGQPHGWVETYRRCPDSCTKSSHRAQDGVLITRAHFADGLRQGVSQYFGGSGALRMQREFDRDKEHGIYRYWDKRGNLMSSIIHHRGAKISMVVYRPKDLVRVEFRFQGDGDVWYNERSVAGVVTNRTITSAIPPRMTTWVWSRLGQKKYKKCASVRPGGKSVEKHWHPDGRLLVKETRFNGELHGERINLRRSLISEYYWHGILCIGGRDQFERYRENEDTPMSMG